MFAPGYDRRIKAAVCSGGSTNFKDTLKHDTGIQFEFVISRFLLYGNLEDVVRLVDPASLLIFGTEQDKWSLSIDTICQYAQPAFVEGVLEHRLYPGKHEFTEDMRTHAYKFLDDRLGS